MSTAGFRMTTTERKAMELAVARWQEFKARNRQFRRALEEPDRLSFSKLGKAVRALQKALEPFADTSPERAHMLCLIQDCAVPLRPQWQFGAMLDGISESLPLLDAAARRGAGGAGRAVDPFDRRWVRVAADAWREVCKKEPRPSGRFCAALLATSSDETQPVSERAIRTVLSE